MAIKYSTFSNLVPIKLKYANQPSNLINYTPLSYNNGISFFSSPFLQGYQDIVINRNSCLMLTSKTTIQNIFNPQITRELGAISTSIFISPRTNTNAFASYNTIQKRFILGTSSNRTAITISPTQDKGVVELVSNGQFLQVKSEYPYEITLADFALYNTNISRQRFNLINLRDNLFALKASTPDGERFIAFNNDGVLRATGVVLNGITPSNYILLCTFISPTTLNTGFSPIDYWVTYFNDTAQVNNNNVTINQKIPITQNNFLIDFPVEETTKTNIASINILTLKNNLTPTELPAPVTNNYNPILSN